uniref:Phospholipid-transporting ATPase n=1 Tax=Schistocephalus solidus TaxID=70667 RepID=A0A0V0J415_SCHSO
MGGLDCSKLHLLSKKSQQERCVVLNHSKINRHSADSVNRQFPKNVAVSSHYTWWNFLVLDIFEQMHSVSNFFFTMISIIFFFGETPISPATVVAPLIVVMSVQIIKDGYDDLGRHLNDKKINDTPFLVWVHKDRGFEVESSWDSVKARNIRCGDLILCREGESFPCDTLLLASSNHDGKVAVTTGNLDGESSVKTRFTLPATQKPFEVLLKEFNSPGTLGSLLGDVNFPSVAHIVCQNPTDDFGTFEGRLEYATANTEGNGTDNQHSIPLTIENIGLRGATLRTSGVICVAIYTGKDTKLSLNAKCGQKKTSSTKHRFNSILLIFILAMLILTLIFVGIEYGWQNQVSGSGWYLVYGQLTAWKVTQGAFDEAILMNYLIPISMIVIMEIVQFFLALYAVNDITFYDEHLGKHCQVNATNIAEELGQVEFLFSDKTGTLTENKMEFRCFALAEENHAYSLEEDGLYKISGKPKQYSNEGVPMGVKEFVDVTFESSEDENEADSFAKQASRHWQRGTERVTEHSEEAELFWKVATLCHSVEVKASSEAEEQKGDNMNYSAASPDELALVRAAAKCGFVYLGRESTTDEWTDLGRETVRVSTLSGAAGGDGRKLLHFYRGGTLEFDSTRRRMSVLVQSAQDGRCFVFSKGAETAILNQRVSSGSPPRIHDNVTRQVNDFASRGLRTLVFAAREVSASLYRTMVDELKRAQGLTGQERIKALEKISAKIESRLSLVGVSGVEDRLQPGVKRCLRSLITAGIQVWVLTGDKEETATKISQTAGLFSRQMTLLRLTQYENVESVARAISDHLKLIQMTPELVLDQAGGNPAPPGSVTTCSTVASVPSEGETSVSLTRVTRTQCAARWLEKLRSWFQQAWTTGHRKGHQQRNGTRTIGLVIDGQTLRYATSDILRRNFLKLCLEASTVLCCRLTPFQKAAVVKLVAEGTKDVIGLKAPVTAAVGDGGNDVAMLLQANVGIGIFGNEGRQAVRAADYAFPLFKHLQRLFLVHGQWNYYRMSFMALLFYHKCIALVAAQIYQLSFSGFSAQPLFDSLLYALYNLTMTSCSICAFGLFERHLSEADLLRHPFLYRLMSQNANYSPWYVVLWCLDGLWLGSVCYFISYFVLVGGGVYAEAIFVLTGTSYATLDIDLFGTAVFLYLTIAVNFRLFVITRTFTLALIIGNIAFGVGNFIVTYVYQRMTSPISIFYMNLSYLAHCPAFWLAMPLSLTLGLLPDLLWRLGSDYWWKQQISRGSDRGRKSKAARTLLRGSPTLNLTEL